MSMPEVESAALEIELRQSRDFTRAEQRDLLRLWGNALWPDGAGFLYNAPHYLFYGFAAFLALSAWMVIARLWPTEPQLAAQLAIAAIGFALGFVLLQWVSNRAWRNLYWQNQAPDDRYQITADGLRRVSARSDGLLRWRGIDRLIVMEHYVVVISGGSAVLLAKAALAGKDVEGFCAEIERRWHAARAQPK